MRFGAFCRNSLALALVAILGSASAFAWPPFASVAELVSVLNGKSSLTERAQLLVEYLKQPHSRLLGPDDANDPRLLAAIGETLRELGEASAAAGPEGGQAAGTGSQAVTVVNGALTVVGRAETEKELVTRTFAHLDLSRIPEGSPLWDGLDRVLQPAPNRFAAPDVLHSVLRDMTTMEGVAMLPRSLERTLIGVARLGEGTTRTTAPVGMRTNAVELEAISRLQIARGLAMRCLGFTEGAADNREVQSLLSRAIDARESPEENEGALRGMFDILRTRRLATPALPSASHELAPVDEAADPARVEADQDLLALLMQLRRAGASAELRGQAFLAIWSRVLRVDVGPGRGLDNPQIQRELAIVLAQLVAVPESHLKLPAGSPPVAALPAARAPETAPRLALPAAQTTLVPTSSREPGVAEPTRALTVPSRALTPSGGVVGALREGPPAPDPFDSLPVNQRSRDLAARIITELPRQGLNRVGPESPLWPVLAEALRLDGPTDRIQATAEAFARVRPPEQPELIAALANLAQYSPDLPDGDTLEHPPSHRLEEFGEVRRAKARALEVLHELFGPEITCDFLAMHAKLKQLR